MSRTRGTTKKFKDVYPRGEVVNDLAKQNMILRRELEAAATQVNVTRTLLAAVLYTTRERTVTITPEQIAELEGRAFTIEKRTTEDGGLEVRTELLPVVDAEPVEEVPPRER